MSRKLYSINVHVSTTYRILLHQQLAHHNIIDRLHDLIKVLSQNTSNANLDREAESINTTITKAMLYAKKKAAHTRHDAWSPKLIQAGLTLKYWRIHLSAHHHCRNLDHILYKIHFHVPTLLDPYSSPTPSIPHILKQYCSAKQAARHSKLHANHSDMNSYKNL